MTLKIRRMTLADVPAVYEIDRLSFSLPWTERSFRYEVTENLTSRPWVAELDGRVVGMLVLWVVLDEAHIATIATHPAYRRQGIGERLLVHALKAAYAEGVRRAFLEVRVSNLAAQALYRKYGFVVDGIRPQYYRDTNEDALVMSLNNLEMLEDVVVP